MHYFLLIVLFILSLSSGSKITFLLCFCAVFFSLPKTLLNFFYNILSTMTVTPLNAFQGCKMCKANECDVLSLCIHSYKQEHLLPNTSTASYGKTQGSLKKELHLFLTACVILSRSLFLLSKVGGLTRRCWWWTRGGGLTPGGPAAAWSPACAPSPTGRTAPSTARWRRRSWPAP